MESNATPSEIVSALARARRPALIVEGKDDLMLWRWLEDEVAVAPGMLMVCGGRPSLLEVYRRRREFSHIRAAFVADRDMLVIGGVPDELSEIVWTDGYSIENDIITDANAERLLARAGRMAWESDLDALAQWFAFEIEQWLLGAECQVDVHCSKVVPSPGGGLCSEFIGERGFVAPALQLTADVRAQCRRIVRGRTMADLLVMHLNQQGGGGRWNRSTILEAAVKLCDRGARVRALVEGARAKLLGA